LIDKAKEPFIPRANTQELAEQNKTLQAVCDERLKLIERLSSEAEQRLNIINEFKAKKMKAKKFIWF
jgi:hypothetical protein